MKSITIANSWLFSMGAAEYLCLKLLHPKWKENLKIRPRELSDNFNILYMQVSQMF